MDLYEYIDRYINFKASPQVQERGIELYNQGAVSLSYANEASDAWHFSVQGGQRYAVIIRDLNKGDLKTSCSCPFEWGSICKHTVAALMFIKDGGEHRVNKEQKSAVKPTSLRTAHGYLIKNYQFISQQDIEEHTSVSVINDILHGYNNLILQDVKIDDSEIIFEYTTYYENQWAAITYRNDKVYIRSSSKKPIPKLNKVEAHTLLLIAQSKSPDLLNILFSSAIDDQKEGTLAKYGLPQDADFDQFFSYGFHPDEGLVFLFRPDQLGLLPVDPNYKINFRQFIDDLNEEKLELDAIPRKDEERMLGFVVQFSKDDYDEYDGEADFTVIPVVGKPNKDRSLLSSHIERYDEYSNVDKIKVSKNAQEIIHTVERLYTINSEKPSFVVKRKLIHLLANERIVHYRTVSDFKIKKSELSNARIMKAPVTARYEAYQDEQFVGLRLKVNLDGEERPAEEIDAFYRHAHIYMYKGKIGVPINYTVARHIALWTQELKMVKSHRQYFFNEIVMPLSKNFEIDFGNSGFEIESVELDFRKKQVYLSELHDFLIITPQVEYHNGVSVMLNQSGNVLVDENGEVTEYKRNIELEDDFVDSIAELHPYFEEQKEDKRFYLHYDTFTEDMWFYRFFEQMQHLEVEVFGLKELKNFKYSPFAGKVSTTISSGQDWFEVDLKVSFGDTNVKLSDIKKAVLNQQKYIQLKDGSVGMLPNEWFHKLEKFFRHGEVKDGKLAVSKMRFAIIDELFDDIDDMQILSDIAEKTSTPGQFY